MCSAADEPFKLFTADKNASQDEAFAFDRTASRLQDMMSQVPPAVCLFACLLSSLVSLRREDLTGRWSRRAGARSADGWARGTNRST